jgi:predicted GNAT family acetyltransferase
MLPTSRETIGHVTIDSEPRAIDIDPEEGQFEIRVEDYVAFIAYDAEPSVLALIHTEVPPELRGKGLAEALARTALQYAREHVMTVEPFCPFVSSFIKRHPEFQDLIAPRFHARGGAGA